MKISCRSASGVGRVAAQRDPEERGPVMPFAEINGQRIRYEDSGGDGPPVILSHGFLMDHEMFAPQVEALAPEFRAAVRSYGLRWRSLAVMMRRRT